jgi:hypothetical protein
MGAEMNITQIAEAVVANRVRIGDQAFEQILALKLDCEELAYSVVHGEIAEEFADRPYPTCLIHGPTFADEPLHSEWAWNKESGWAACVSVRRPVPPSRAGAEEGEKPR